ncbi:MAG: hypothetical protein EXR01_01560 [Acetobacteraceae bacterium]|nr:hypothetical protein [Acetobacteraceae bacterium]
MPGMDGPSLVCALREGQPGLPAIQISDYANEWLRTVMNYENITFANALHDESLAGPGGGDSHAVPAD